MGVPEHKNIIKKMPKKRLLEGAIANGSYYTLRDEKGVNIFFKSASMKLTIRLKADEAMTHEVC